jgi:hypothetical protein
MQDRLSRAGRMARLQTSTSLTLGAAADRSPWDQRRKERPETKRSWRSFCGSLQRTWVRVLIRTGASPMVISHRKSCESERGRGVITHKPPWLMLWMYPAIACPLVRLFPSIGNSVRETLRCWGNRGWLRRSVLRSVFTPGHDCACVGRSTLLRWRNPPRL